MPRRWSGVESRARPVVVVTGHAANSILAALKDHDLQFVHAEDHAAGQSCSLRKGVAVLPRDVDGVVVLLADMPLISSTLIDELINVFETSPGAAAVVPTFAGRRGNPALLGRRLFPRSQGSRLTAGLARYSCMPKALSSIPWRMHLFTSMSIRRKTCGASERRAGGDHVPSERTSAMSDIEMMSLLKTKCQRVPCSPELSAWWSKNSLA